MGAATRVLIIDDDESEVEAMRVALESRHYHVLTAADGRAGLEIARNCHPELVIVDLIIPPPNGFAVCDELRNALGAYHPMIMIVTGLGEKMHKNKNSAEIKLRMDADDYLEKPIDPADFLNRVDALGDKCHLEPNSMGENNG